jgi:molecular chaperone GrpE
MATFVLQTFRSRASLPSTRVISRSTPLRRRHYSEETPKIEKEESNGASNKAEGSVLTPDQEKLKAKEAEVIDLTVRVTRGKRGKITHKSLTGTPPLFAR